MGGGTGKLQEDLFTPPIFPIKKLGNFGEHREQKLSMIYFLKRVKCFQHKIFFIQNAL